MQVHSLRLPERVQSPIRFNVDPGKQAPPRTVITPQYVYAVIAGRVVAVRNEVVRRCSSIPVDE